ncbi:MAG TPA: protein kinase [Thermoanaerobaculia bacterium]|nr:protein kinase [Thermoanaerobaculia bacterium]
MTLVSGARLGPYEISDPIGAGGMGEVYKARDTRLERSVAIKILPAEFANNTQFKLRFEREAKAISQLNHPHICTLHDVGEEGGVSYLVMELVEGESLADRLGRGALPMSDVLKYGAQIADALDRAHRAGIVHRDLKPGNIMITRSGAKLLDFGLAKSSPMAAPLSAASLEGATQQRPLTQEGTVLGTFQYMAPEQLAGEEADARTDIFAFGAVLYEMATGRRAFEGKNRTSLIAQIVGGEPRPMREIQPLTPLPFEHIVQKCLSKDPDDRWQSAHDLAEELKWIGQAGSQADALMAPVARRKSRERLAWTLVLIATSIAIAALVQSRIATARQKQAAIRRFNLAIPPEVFIDRRANGPVALTPGGRAIVYVAFSGSTSHLFLRPLDSFEATQIAGSADAVAPFFSPDGQWIGFVANGGLRKVPVSGGAPVTICNGCATNDRGATWGPDQMIYFAPAAATGIYRISAGGGTPVAVSRPSAERNELSHRWPQLLPDGKHLLVTVKTLGIASFDEARIGVVSLVDGKTKIVFEGGTFGRYLPTGQIVFARGSSLYAVAFDMKTMEVRGAPVRVLDSVFVDPDTGSAQYAFSPAGALVGLPGIVTPGVSLVAVDRAGRERPITNQSHRLAHERLSPDGRTVAMNRGAANDDIVLADLARGTMTRLSFEPGNEDYPVWSADGSRVFYLAEVPGEGMSQIASRAADGSGKAEEIFRSHNDMYPTSVSPDGKLLAYCEATPTAGLDLWLLSLADGKRMPLIQTPFNEQAAAFSSDGRWIAYESNESGKDQVYVRSLAEGGGRWQVSIDGGQFPQWSRDGREIFYWNDTDFYRVPVTVAPTFSPGQPEKLFSNRSTYWLTDSYDLTPDGSFLMISRSGEFEARHFNFVVDWFDEVKQRMTGNGS